MSAVRVVAERPAPGDPSAYAFPSVERTRLPNGLAVVACHLPGRPLLAASLVMGPGAAEEPAAAAGSTILMARAMTEGTARQDAIALVEATERLGASLHAEAGWDATSISVDVPAERLPDVLDLVAEVLTEPAFPVDEVDRLREERLNDLLQARADPRRRVEEAFIETIYAPSSPYHRPAAGLRETVERLDVTAIRAEHARRLDPSGMTLVVGGDLEGLDVPALAAARFGSLAVGGAHGFRAPDDAASHVGRRIRLIHRPGSVQTEIRVGHVGLPRRIADYHAVAVMSAILGGLFNSRLNRKLREEKGYTYGAHAGFDFRLGAGPFGARAAVNTEVTVPALQDLLAELVAITEAPVAAEELDDARNYLIGVFPLRFESPGSVVGALTGLAVHGLPDDELDRYRPAIAAVSADAVLEAARAHVHPDRASIVLVGDADRILEDLERAGIAPVTVERDAASSPEVVDGPVA